MSGITTALGVAASAAQLADYGITIIQFFGGIYNRIQNAPQQYREYNAQLNLLVNLAQNIKNTPALQTQNVKYHLDATLLEVTALQSILCSPASGCGRDSGKRNYWGLIKGFEEKKIAALLNRLHQKNMGLCLLVQTINTTQISSIQQNMQRLVIVGNVGLQTPAERNVATDVRLHRRQFNLLEQTG